MKHNIKLKRAVEQANIFKGQSTVSAIKEQLPEELIDKLNSKELALVLEAINKAYHHGRASTGAEMIDSNCVYINSINRMIEWKVKDGVLVPKFCT